MPVILSPASGSMWIDPSATVTASEKLLLPFPADKMEAWKVSRQVSVPTFDNPDCLKKLEVIEPVEKKFKSHETQSSFFD